ncbi:MAG TPA: superoxide dismutase family protein [Candidatus Methylomirabilis sp.]|nr:superoxide dismutase family protein [Candidatus Methylomirabilis sp.]
MSAPAREVSVASGSRIAARLAPWIVALALTTAACRFLYFPPLTPAPPAAVARLVDSSGRPAGTAVFLQQGSEVRVLLDVTGLPAGSKGVHIHEVGKCDPPSFESAGAHFNPTKAAHGAANPRGPHAGDLGNIYVDPTGKGHLELSTSRITLKKGSTSIFDADGSSIVVHQSGDDQRTDPTGNSGPPLACGVIIRAG